MYCECCIFFLFYFIEDEDNLYIEMIMVCYFLKL